MEHIIGTILTLGYSALFLLLISRMNFFRIGNIPVKWFQAVFVLKVLSGFFLYLIYTYYYTDRSTADIWKYYDDGMVLFSALREHPMDYLQMLFGIGNNEPQFDLYYNQMNHWYRPYGSSIANDTHTIIRFNAFVRLFSLGYYNVHSVIINFLGLIGLTGILHFLKQMDPTKEKWFFAGVFLLPGIMFWASGVLKEPLLLLGLGLFLFGVMKLVSDGGSVKRMVLIILSLFFLITVKSYALAAVVPGLISWFSARKFPKPHPLIWFVSVFVIGVVGVVLLGKVYPEKSLLSRMEQRQYEFYQLAEGGTYVKTEFGDTIYIYSRYYENLQFSDNRETIQMLAESGAIEWRKAKTLHEELILLPSGSEFEVLLDYGKTGSAIETPRLDGSVLSLLKAIPMALVNATFRPFPWNIRSPFMLLSGLENMIILFLLVLAVVGVWRKKAFPRSPIFYMALSFALVILILTGLVTPVVGAIVRYKVPALPFLVCALITLIDTGEVESILLAQVPFLKRYF